ncbi:uncharacterized protein CELE_T23F11.11 [Caenorhabditis elegans]|uniref:Transmembrane protein n=1 Tax=Caenorhabditis elegans TaxID=6239 RepID=H2L269_CAEEL|nr:Transmembrane protein [Caenorhabditis elegans]CCE72290.1 Transmembrane protein [Caenorhabditis elegans]|eukprot:NP_001254919.1 Uncharacterized protein CELE_T23F11.11 [Caenorhabditis elegans]
MHIPNIVADKNCSSEYEFLPLLFRDAPTLSIWGEHLTYFFLLQEENVSGTIRVLLYCSIVLYSIFLIFSSIPVYLLVIGIVKVNQCPVDQRIPVWLIVNSALIFLQGSFECIMEQVQGKSKSMALFILLNICRLGIFVSTIVGSVFVFAAYSGKAQCDGLLYWSSFVYCILSLIACLFSGCSFEFMRYKGVNV